MKSTKGAVGIFITAIVSIVGTIVLKDYTSLDEILADIMKQWNNSNAVANTFGVTTSAVVFIALKYAFSTKQKTEDNEQSIKIDLTSATGETKVLAEKFDNYAAKYDLIVDNQIKNNESLQKLNQMLMKFANATTIDEDVKIDMITLYGEVKNNTIQLTQEAKTMIEETVEKATNIVDKTKAQVEKVNKESKSILDRYREELK